MYKKMLQNFGIPLGKHGDALVFATFLRKGDQMIITAVALLQLGDNILFLVVIIISRLVLLTTLRIQRKK